MTRQPLSVEERDRAYAMQERLDALKECGRCERWLPVRLFDGYGGRRVMPAAARWPWNMRAPAAGHAGSR